MKKILYLLLICSISAFGQKVPSPAFIDSIVNASMKEMPHAGVAVALVKDGQIVHQKGYGLASANSGSRVDENTLFAIASNSKAFTTTALGILVDRGQLKWTDKVVKYIPEFTMYDPWVREHFTLVDLLTHRSGLGLGAGDLMFFPDGSDYTVDDVIRSFQFQEVKSEFRTKYDYDNLLYVVAGEVVKRVSGKPWDLFVQEEIMRPLGMNRSVGIFQNLKAENNVAMPHKVINGQIEEFPTYTKKDGSLGAAGGIYSCVSELSKWVMMHLDEGKFGNKMLISMENHDALWQIYTQIAFRAKGRGNYNNHYLGYGLGFRLSDQMGYTVVEHTGGLPGMLSYITMIPELNAGIIVLTNCDPGGYAYVSVTRAIKDELIGAPQTDWVDVMKSVIADASDTDNEVVTSVWETVAKNKEIPIDKAMFTGTYADPWFGEVEVYEKEGNLWFASKRSPQLNGPMSFYKGNTFAIKWQYNDMDCDAFAIFQLDENGKADAIKMKGISPNIDFSYDFQDLKLTRVR